MVGVHGGGHILVGIAVGRVGDDEGCLAHRSVTNEDALDLVVAAHKQDHKKKFREQCNL